MRTIGNLTISGSLNTSGSITATTFIGVVSSSAQLSTEISGAFTSTSASLASDIQNNDTRLSTLEGKTLVSSSAQLSDTTIPGSLTVGGILTAQEFHTEFVSASIIYQSGSTQFGNSLDDVHNFSGSLAVNTNNLFVSGGRVGISTTNPITALHAYHATFNTVGYFESGDSGVNITFKDNNSSNRAFVGATGDRLYLGHINNGEQVVVEANGNVGIGTTSVDASNPKLDVMGSIMSKGSSITAAPTSESIVIDYHTPSNAGRIMVGSGSAWNKNIALNPYGGNVGVGTTVPDSKLHIQGSAQIGDNNDANGDLTLSIFSGQRLVTLGTSTLELLAANNTNATWGRAKLIVTSPTAASSVLAFHTNVNTSATAERMRIHSNGNVGIGTSSPTQKLDVNGNTRIDGTLNLNAAPIASNFILNAYYNSASTMVNQFEHGSNQAVSFGVYNKQSTARDYGGALTLNADGTFVIQHRVANTDTEVITINNSNNVGIGTSSPISKLTVNGESNYNGGLSLTSITGIPSLAASFIYRPADNTLAFGTGNVERMRLTPSGSLLIGTTTQGYSQQSYGYLLGVKSNANQAFISIAKSGQTLDTQGMIVGLDATTGYVWLRESISLTLGTADSPKLTITSGGNVGIGTTSPSYKLHVNGSVAGVGAYNNLSDVNYKKNINDLELGLGIVKQLRPITYNWINEEYGTRTNIGFIAQEVESVLPNIVTTADDNVKSMASTDLIPVLTKAIQEQQAQIETLQTELDAKSLIIKTQEQKIQELETLLQTLVSRIETLENK